MIRRALLVVAVLAVLAVQTPAQAQWGMGGGLGYGGFGTSYFGNGLPAGWYTGVQGRMPPYFALHPPVYYSGQIVRIPYGASPFANPWGNYPAPASILPPPAPAPAGGNESRSIENPFFKPRELAARPSPELGVMIENPYYRPEGLAARNEP
jgi:hypothetical protein